MPPQGLASIERRSQEFNKLTANPEFFKQSAPTVFQALITTAKEAANAAAALLPTPALADLDVNSFSEELATLCYQQAVLDSGTLIRFTNELDKIFAAALAAIKATYQESLKLNDLKESMTQRAAPPMSKSRSRSTAQSLKPSTNLARDVHGGALPRGTCFYV